MEHDTVRIPSPKEMEAFIKDQDILEAHIKGLSDEEKDKIFDNGYHDDTVKGYIMLAMEAAGLKETDIAKTTKAADRILKEVSVVEARAKYNAR